MRAGNLDCRIVIEYPVAAVDATYGTETITWAPLVAAGSPLAAVPLWAQWQDTLPSRSESVQNGLAMSRNQARIRMRYRADLTSAMRVTDYRTGVVYQIVGGPATIGRNQWSEIVVERYSS